MRSGFNFGESASREADQPWEKLDWACVFGARYVCVLMSVVRGLERGKVQGIRGKMGCGRIRRIPSV